MRSQMLSSYLVLVLAGLATLDAALIRTSRAACPEVKTKPDFDYRPYAGLWYEIQRFANVFQEGSTCERAIYEEISENVVSVINTAVLSDGSLINITGSARPLDDENPGFLIVSFPGRPDGTYLVLDTDYDSYASVYSCTALGSFAFEFAWLLARENTISQELLDLALSKFTQYGINIGKFEETAQGQECIYYPPYPFPRV